MTVSDWGPDSPADDPDVGGKWLAVFVGEPGSNRLVQAPLDEHFPPAELDGYRLLAANEVTRVATYRRAADTDGPVPVSTVAQGATNTPNPDPSAIPSGNSGSGRLRAEVARALGNAGVSPFEIEDFRIEDVADRLHRAGFRLVSEDEATVERVARALCHDDGHLWPGDDADLVQDASTAWTVTGKPWRYRAAARAAVRALREGQA